MLGRCVEDYASRAFAAPGLLSASAHISIGETIGGAISCPAENGEVNLLRPWNEG